MVDAWRVQDNIVCSCPRPLKYVFKIKDDYSPMTKVLLTLLGRISTSATAFEKPTIFALEKDERGVGCRYRICSRSNSLGRFAIQNYLPGLNSNQNNTCALLHVVPVVYN